MKRMKRFACRGRHGDYVELGEREDESNRFRIQVREDESNMLEEGRSNSLHDRADALAMAAWLIEFALRQEGR